MKGILATVRGGRVEQTVPESWMEGTQVEIMPVESDADLDDETPTPEEIARTLAAFDQRICLEWTEAERAEWEAERAGEVKDVDFATLLDPNLRARGISVRAFFYCRPSLSPHTRVGDSEHLNPAAAMPSRAFHPLGLV